MSTVLRNEDTIKEISILELSKGSTLFSSLVHQVFDQHIEDDYYDMRREQINFIADVLNLSEEETKTCFDQYYQDGKMSHLALYIQQLNAEQQKIFDAIQPYRKRAFGEWECMYLNGQWRSLALPIRPFVQEGIDYRAVARKFVSLGETFLQDQEVHAVVGEILTRVQARQPQMKTALVECHAMRLCTSGKARSNTPEGIHQDGVDYIMNFVIARESVDGGVSRVFQKDSSAELQIVKEVVLEAGQGLFISDKGSNVYHDATPVRLVEGASGCGYRDLLGFDVQIIG